MKVKLDHTMVMNTTNNIQQCGKNLLSDVCSAHIPTEKDMMIRSLVLAELFALAHFQLAVIIRGYIDHI